MRRLIVGIALSMIVTASAQQPPQLPQKGSGPGKPLSPQEAQKLFKLDDGLKIELVACEPQIESPVAMQFDPDGRLWVVEMRDYPNGPKAGEKPAGRIRILEDKDGDGFFETSKIWADNLLFANGLFLWKDGAIVTMAPKITHLRDTNGDGKADKEDILFTGFAELNPQLRVSHPIMGPDGWIYCANGLRGGKVIRSPLPSGGEGPGVRGQPVDLSGMDFKFDPVDLAKYEPITGPGQYGNTFDEWGNRFVCDNRHHLRHVVMEQRYIKRNPYLAAPSLLEDISVLEDGPLSSGGKVYPLSKNWTTSSLHEGRFTAACGVFIYQSNLLNQSLKRKRSDDAKDFANASGSDMYRGAAFTCEPTGNLVHMEILTPKGATFEARPHKQGVEFLATTDDWFRPVFLTHGPEGALYIADMYRAVIEHPEFMPPELKNRPDLTAGKDKGRIWRIVPKDHKTKTPRPGLSKASFAELVKALEHEEPWYRQTAQRLLLEKNDKAMIEPLTKLLETTKSPHAKIVAAWMLERQGKLNEKQLVQGLKDDHPRVREHAIRIVEPALEKSKYWEEVTDACKHQDARLCYQAALTTARLELKHIDPKLDVALIKGLRALALWRIVMDAKTDRWSRLAVLTIRPDDDTLAALLVMAVTAGTSSGEPMKKDMKELGIQYSEHNRAVFVREAALLMATRKISTTLDQRLAILGVGALSDQKLERDWDFLAGYAEGLERRGTRIPEIARELDEADRSVFSKSLENVFIEARKRLDHAKRPTSERLNSLRILSHAPWPSVKPALLPLIEKEPNTELRIAALRAITSQQDKEVPALLMKLWPGAAPSMRREILEAMLRQPARVNVLLDEIESTRMKASELDPLRTKQLMNHKDQAIRARAAKLLAANIPADRQKVLKEYQAALDFKGDAKNGREIFKKNCATCHRVAGLGIDVGPDIADTRTKTLGAILNDILVPNAAIDANYVNYVVATKDGRILTGMLTAETASSITVLRAEKQSDVVLRKDIDEIQSTGISLMPEGFEKQISVREMADLLRFLKDWRYLDGSVPFK